MKTLVIGLDGATFDLIHPFISKGFLPNLKRMMEQGAWSELTSTVPPVTASAWTSFMTGKNPGGHGLYDFMRRRTNSYDLSPVSSLDRDGKAVWEITGEADKKVIVMGVPVTYPPAPVNGLMVTGMLTPRGAKDFTYPPKLADEIKNAVGDYIVYSDEVYSKGRGEVFMHALHQSVKQRSQAAAYLMQKYEWDLSVVVFPETDTVCHGMWWAYDVTHHQHNRDDAKKFHDSILEIYQHIDSCLGELVSTLPPNIQIFVMSDHGHGPLKNFLYVNNFLKEKGYLKIKGDAKSQFKNLSFKLGVTPRTVYGMLLSLGLGKMRRTLDKRRGGRGLLKRFFLSLNDVDWDRTKAYSVGYIGEVHINLKGREPNGIVQRGEEYEQLREQLMRDLREMRLPDGSILVEQIWKKEEIYSGAHLDEAPDILFLPKNLETISFGDFEFGSNKVIEPSYGVSSSHRMNGILIANGPTIQNDAQVRSPSLIDLAPTILYALGLPVPRDMDGRVLQEIFRGEHDVVFGGTSARLSSAPSEAQGYSDDEEMEVVDRLKDLGYIS